MAYSGMKQDIFIASASVPIIARLFFRRLATAMVAESFTVLALSGKAIDLPGLAQLAACAGIAWSLAFVIHKT